ncbi:hypothetical protein KJ835_04130, partial [Patescibacteria group bacterium]|nr:hypothetical protein [Patescibacteria group bacterium]
MYHLWRRKAVALRKAGYSYSLIQQKVPVSKSTLSYWLSEIKYIPNELVKARVNSALLKSSITRHERRMNEVKKIKKKAKNTFLSFSKRDMFLFGLGIYLGEGAKMSQRVRIINANPQVIRFMVRWLAEVFEIPVKNLSLTIHLYPDCNVDESLKYWSKITKIPIKQFRKTQIDI